MRAAARQRRGRSRDRGGAGGAARRSRPHLRPAALAPAAPPVRRRRRRSCSIRRPSSAGRTAGGSSACSRSGARCAGATSTAPGGSPRSHRQTEGEDFAEATWLAGWLALRHADQPSEAFRRFIAHVRGGLGADRAGTGRLLGRPQRRGARRPGARPLLVPGRRAPPDRLLRPAGRDRARRAGARPNPCRCPTSGSAPRSRPARSPGSCAC